MPASSGFKLTYSTMFNPPPQLHARFDAALADFIGKMKRSMALG